MPEGYTGKVCVTVVPTGAVSPGKKRDIALKYTRSDILAFIDDDVYPDKYWLKNAVLNFSDPSVAAVGGPAVTPPEDGLRQKASGLIYSSFLVGGTYAYRYAPKAGREVDDYPSCNFLVRRNIMEEVGGFNTDFWPGEDTKFCLDITKRLGKKIIYDPKALVYHHRRPVFIPHLKQIASYARHRGYFVKRFPQTSLRISYFIPAIFLIFVLAGAVASSLYAPVKTIYLTILAFYAVLAFIASINPDIRIIPLVFLGIILSHLAYGFYFMSGIIAKRLKEDS